MNTNNFSWGLTPADDHIAHFGVKGMHWGERRYQYKDGTYTPLGKKRRGDTTPDSAISEDYKRAHSNRDPRTMSTDELNKVNNRRNAESNYKRATRTVAATIAATVATQVVTETLKNTGTKAVKAGLESAGKKVADTVKAHPKATAAAVIAAAATTAVVVHHQRKKAARAAQNDRSGEDFDGVYSDDGGSEQEDVEHSSIAHGTAHYSKNWNKADQTAYNKEYYQQHKDKWGVKDSASKTSSGSTFGEYSEDDPAFADSTYDEKNVISDTDYFVYTDENGNQTIVSEDMKWVLPAGTKVDSEMKRRLKAVGEIIDQRQSDGEKTTNDTFRQLTAQAINGSLDVNEDRKRKQVNNLGGTSNNRNKYLDDIYDQAEAHLKEKDIDAESEAGKAFYKKFDELVASQAKTVI